VLLDGVGHAPHLEAPAQTIDAIVDCVRSWCRSDRA
jgi:pimeloyl-ACP methyl ester carboxylesterase